MPTYIRIYMTPSYFSYLYPLFGCLSVFTTATARFHPGVTPNLAAIVLVLRESYVLHTRIKREEAYLAPKRQLVRLMYTLVYLHTCPVL